MTPAPFPATEALPEALRQELARRRHLNVFRMLMHTPRVAPGFLAMTDVLRHDNSLPVALRELAILRVGRRYGAAYEVHHHERIARAGGLGEAGIAAAARGVAADADTPDPVQATAQSAARQTVAPSDLSAAERLVLALTDELLERHGLSEDGRARALQQFDLTQLADLVLTVGHYQQVCLFLNTFGVPIEGRADGASGMGGRPVR